MDMRENIFRSADYFKDDLPIILYLYEHLPRVSPPEVLNRREFWKISYVVEGTGILRINRREYQFGPGFVYLIHPDDLTNYTLEKPVKVYNLLFRRKFVEGELTRLYDGNRFFAIFKPEFRPEGSFSHEQLHLLDSSRKMQAMFRRMHHEYTHADANTEEVLRYMLLLLMVEFARASSRQFTRRRREEAIGEIETYLQTHYAETIRAETIAREVGLSKGYLFSLYRKTTGKTIGQTLLKIRIEAAKKLLSETNLEVNAVCYRCGFSDPSNFHKLFRRETNTTPTSFR